MNNFVRGQDPKESMSIGRDAILKEIGGLIVDKLHGEEKFSPETNVVILLTKGLYKITRIKFRYDGPEEGEEKDLIHTLLKLQEAFRKWDPNDFFFPIAQQVAARTIGIDLVAVKPMSGPTGHLAYLDYRYKRQNVLQKIFNKIFPAKPSKKPNI